MLDERLDYLENPDRYEQSKKENVNHPDHYKVQDGDGNELECIDLIEMLGLGFNTGNALKYLWRAGRKDPGKVKEDLKKAVFYLTREIDNLSK